MKLPRGLKNNLDNRGNILLVATMFGLLAFSFTVAAISNYALSENRASVYKHNRERAFQISEAGTNYYRWHLAHNNTDYKDGTSSTGPYYHDFEDKDGNVIGRYALTVTQPPTGTTVVTIDSQGWLLSQENSKRNIKIQVGFPSLTDYSFLTNSQIWIGNTESTHGKFQSNDGVHFDGVCDAPVMSAVPTFYCDSSIGCSGKQNGVFGSGGPSQFFIYPMPSKDFSAVTAKLSTIKTNAGISLSSSGAYGWYLKFLSSGKIYISKVTGVTKCLSGGGWGGWGGWGASDCWDITSTSSGATHDMPTSTYIYVADNTWVDGVVKGRVTVGAASDTKNPSIVVNGNLTYAAKDGTNAIGLIAEDDIIVPYYSPDNLEIDAAMLAQYGKVYRPEYSNTKKTITIYGSILTYDQWTWSYVNSSNVVISGYITTTNMYDGNLTYSPPPGFPVGSEYSPISWEETD
ncbi:MAG: hypothetical protein WC457_04635 [Patescibacteria group bacterium]